MTYPLYGPVNRRGAGYIARTLEDDILNAVLQGRYVNLTGGRQTGKTTALLSLRAALGDSGYVTAYIDLSPIGEVGEDVARWYGLLGETIRTSLLPEEIRDYAPAAPSDHTSLQNYLVELVRAAQAHGSVVIMLDEVTAVPGKLLRPFFSTIRAIYNLRTDDAAPPEVRNVAFVFAGSFDPLRLIENSHNSPFNIAKTIDTARYDFTLEQTATLIAQNSGEFDASDIYAWTSGHPYLTNALCDAMQSVKTLDVESVARGLVSNDSHFAYVSRFLTEQSEDLVALAIRLADGERFTYVPGMLPRLDRLMTMGIVKPGVENNAVIRCALYKLLLEHVRVHGKLKDVAPSPTDPVSFLPGGPLRDHAASLLQLSKEVSRKSPALSAICVGCVLELSLLWALENGPSLAAATSAFASEVRAQRLKVRALPSATPADWTLEQMIEVARLAGYIQPSSSQVSHAIRAWRNLVHPARYRKDYPAGVGLEVAEAAIAIGHLILSELRSVFPPQP